MKKGTRRRKKKKNENHNIATLSFASIMITETSPNKVDRTDPEQLVGVVSILACS